MPPLVSVVIPSYNRATLLPAAIDSVLEQTYPNIELIVVDDGSTDNTASVLEPYRRRVRVVKQLNAGASAARNNGIAVSRGQYLAFLDSDDLWLPRKIEAQVAMMESCGPSVPCCICNMRLAYADGREGRSFALSLIEPALRQGLWVNPLQVLATRFVLFNQAVLVRREALERVGAFDEQCRFMEDYDLALRLALAGAWAYLAEPLAVWNEGTAGSLTRHAEDERVELQRIVHRIHCKIGRLAVDAACSTRQRRQLAFERSRARARLEAAQLMRHRLAPVRMIGSALRRLEKLLDSAYTHSPWYPAMQVAAVEAATRPLNGPSTSWEAASWSQKS